MIGKLRALLGWFSLSSKPTTPNLMERLRQNTPTLPEQHPEELPVPRWEGRTLRGHVILDLVQQAAGTSGRNTLFGAEVITSSGKRYTLVFMHTLPEVPLVVGWNIQFLNPEGKKLKVGRLTRILRLEPDGGVYVNLMRPTPESYLEAVQTGPSAVHPYIRALHWEPI
ncbi:hypothetical protein [Deinococcus cellulosilyticus]|uniref:Uncharacterized protein n=1 Tax=Deinococcus cellulosilyticus (strain DSM 18568 / NBRC 106333 / KACC 11606 / 5516J-15) TaxID=1223518 RepID=A0A511N0Y0_DEIC1|nr:hypothetical protein [Deinococcus cellulosilyticus]GEM46117.1 hypothetical protein DC3_17520 [Deinococcus cellulosilyticus NBRC 106333 = KACC 11606]